MTSWNPGLKSLATLFCNSLWGKTAQRDDMAKKSICTTAEQVNQIVFNQKNTECQISNHYTDDFGSWVEMSYSERQSPFTPPSEYTNCAIAAATTANARIRLHKMMLFLHQSQVIYCDTDSVIYEIDSANPLHRNPRTDPNAVAEGIYMGNALGEWESELKPGQKI